ncbi:DUF6503 family protein [Algoriphagus machipongonensis]|uniref:Deoxyribose-phosphate aldolase n=1 Tax=Algoriphagus machipongonensis TaxID=388413 RepID=A3I0Y6_9BACT|nr:DUF6503 family protein [Algoriphagus machipongonensis]EAZ80132.1 hypothetical protein ALPR1_15924 [Algoriphagus machipongonensis]
MKISTAIILLAFVFGAMSCDTRTEAEKIVDKAIEAHGGENYKTAKIEFDFRDIHYSIFKNSERFDYSREISDSLGLIKDVLNNSGFQRTINGVEIDTLSEEWIGKYSRSVNSVAYFAYLPFGLNDQAVIKENLGKTVIKGEEYHLIKVTFEKSGGGEDYDDEFLYWFGTDDYLMDYLAYSYHTDGGGVRFREVSSVKEVGGIRFQNYINLKPEDESVSVEKIQDLYLSGDLEVLSEIILENLKVDVLKE